MISQDDTNQPLITVSDDDIHRLEEDLEQRGNAQLNDEENTSDGEVGKNIDSGFIDSRIDDDTE